MKFGKLGGHVVVVNEELLIGRGNFPGGKPGERRHAEQGRGRDCGECGWFRE